MDRVVRLIARTSLSAIFITSGWRIVRDPHPPQADRAAQELPVEVPRLDLVARAQAAAGIAPQLCAGTLALTLFPVTYVGHPFWKIEDPQQRQQQQTHFFKNLGLFGGLVYVAMDAPRHRAKR
jgi:putative oxidoreductase